MVEQRQGNLTFYPHNDQLPILLRAMNLEFYGALPGRLARADKRAAVVEKLALKAAGLMFCNCINDARPDSLRLHCLPNFDLVPKIAIVQQITETTRRGISHRFRFYAGDDFFPEIYLSGKRVVFSDHVLQRFSSRVPNNIGADLSNFLIGFFGTPLLALPIGTGHALIVAYFESLLALTFKETEKEFFITTCLTINEINSLLLEVPPRAFNFHYHPEFTRPKIRNWIPTEWMKNLYKRWQAKVPLPSARASLAKKHWHRVAHWVQGNEQKNGHGPGSRLCFMDNIPGPALLPMRSNQYEPRIDELDMYKKAHPEYDWDAEFAERYGEALVSPDSAPTTPENLVAG